MMLEKKEEKTRRRKKAVGKQVLQPAEEGVPLGAEQGWNALGLAEGCCRRGHVPSPYVFIYCKRMSRPS